ncbi:hypothetical protein ACNQ62_14375 [Sulfitobacter sp. SBS6]|uniref:hypothetical protein n=1 Tax=unclassified Sulfitobacter TaxID=196795 RepID=UPI0036D8D10E
MGKVTDRAVIWVFCVSGVLCLGIIAFLAVQHWVESIPYTDTWAYFRNYHPIRHKLLVAFGWVFAAVSVTAGVVYVGRLAMRRKR